MAEPNDYPLSSDEFFEDIISCRQELDKIEILDNTFFKILREEANAISSKIQKLSDDRPDCSRDRTKYEILFDDYREKVDAFNSSRKELLKKLKTVAKSEGNVENWQHTIGLIDDFVSRHQRDLSGNEGLRTYLEETKQHLLTHIRSFETFTTDQIVESQQLCEKLESYAYYVEKFYEKTHEWEPAEWQTLSLRPKLIPSETSSLDPKPEEEHKVPTVYRCKHCGLYKKAGSDGVG
jgi:chromosome segregation ATPase